MSEPQDDLPQAAPDASGQERAPSKKTFSIHDLAKVEPTIRKFAEPIAARHNVRTSQYRINLVTDTPNAMIIKRGPTVQIYLLWPDALVNMKFLLNEAMHLIATRNMNDSWAVEPIALVTKRGEERRAFYKIEFGDENEIMADLLPRSAIQERVSVETTLTLKDKNTGIVFSIKYDASKRVKSDAYAEARVELSRLVRLFEQHKSEHARAEARLVLGSHPQNDTQNDKMMEYLENVD